MIGCLSGLLLDKDPHQVLIDCNGVGYHVSIPMRVFHNLPDLGGKVTLMTHLAIRGDTYVLYGFNTSRELSIFKLLIRVKSIGAHIALSILSDIPPKDLILAVSNQEINCFTKITGIGKKTAERLLFELKDKLVSKLEMVDYKKGNSVHRDIFNALVSLGYSEKQASFSLKELSDCSDVPSGIRLALKILSKS